ncbi:MAG: T9SS type A sorting domain-containing protein [Bacteroidota bacterium]|jgi:hypothetical protein
MKIRVILFVAFLLCLAGLSARGQNGVSLSPISGADGVFDTVVLNGTTVYRSTGTPGSYALYMYFTCSASIHHQTVYLEVTYLDVGLGYFETQYNSTSNDYQRVAVRYQNNCQQSNRIITAVFQLTDADFRKAQNLGADLRLESDPSLQKQIISATVYFAPTPTFQKYQTDWMGPYTGRTYMGDNLVDATTLNGKVICGYQGWFRTPADPTGLGFVHYFRSTVNDPTVDLWPDITEYSVDEQCPVPGWQLYSGKQAYLFSSANKRTVLRHFQWMEAYGIDCIEVQRFVASIGTVGDPESYRVLGYAREAANRTGRTFYVTYALGGIDTTKAFSKIREDWKYLVDSLKLTVDQRYQHHNEKPVVGVYGFQSSWPWVSPTMADSVIGFFAGSGPYAAFFKGSGEWWWRTDTTLDWAAVVRKMGAYTPWNVGNYAGEEASFYNWLPDKQAMDSAGVLYIPLVYPGFSWDNLMNQLPGTTNHPRRKGAFFWNQFIEAKQIGASTVFVAMFDEIDEGTAIFKIANDVPLNHYFLPIEPGLPSDFYLLLTGYCEKIVNGTVTLPSSMPDFTLQSQPPIPDMISPTFGDTEFSQLTISWTPVVHASGITGYEVELDRAISMVSDTSLTPVLSDGSHRTRVRAMNGLGVKGGWSEVQTFTFRSLAPSAKAHLVSPPDRSLNVPVAANFVWRRSANATSYTLQLSQDSMFVTSVVGDSTIVDTLRQLSLPAQGIRFFWRVRGRNATGSGPWSDVWSFTTIVSAPAAPTLISPSNGATGISINPTLSWNASSGTFSYRLQISTSSSFSPLLLDSSGITGTSYSVSGLAQKTTYYWRVSATNAGGTSLYSNTSSFTTGTTSVEQICSKVPATYDLCQNYPNPFNPNTTIQFSLPKATYVTLKIYNNIGKEVALLVSQYLSAGIYTTELNAAGLPSGVYFYRMQTGSFIETKKLVLLR